MIIICTTCGKEFEKTDNRNKCRHCRLEYRREYGRIHAKELCEKQKIYAEAHKEMYNEYKKKYWIDNKDRLKANFKTWYEKNKEEYLKKCSEYGKLNRDRDRDRERVRKYNSYQKDAKFKIESNLRSRITQALIKQDTTKKETFLKLVGCDMETLKNHLESKFLDGMTWENKGRHGWHIDHIIPVSGLDLTIEENIVKICHYTNLQPLWASDNIKKGNKIK